MCTDRTHEERLGGFSRWGDRRILGSNVGSNPGDRPRREATAKPLQEPIFNLWRPRATLLEGPPTTLSRWTALQPAMCKH